VSFTFGGIRENTKAKDLLKPSDILDYVIEDHFDEDEKDYFIFLLDKFPAEDKKQLILKRIRDAGYRSYKVLVAVDCKYKEEDLKGGSIVEFMMTHRSGWRKDIDCAGTHCRAIMAFGCAMYSINCSADILTGDFYDDQMLRPYYYMGHEIFKYDTYVFPVDGIEELYPTIKSSSNSVNYKTKFFYSQVARMRKTPYEWEPMFLSSDPKFISINSKEEADKVFRDNMNKYLVAFDTETNGLKFYENHIHCLTICWDGLKGYFIPWKYVDVKLFEENVMSCQHRTGANPKFDLKFFWQHGVSRRVNVTDATDRLAHCITSEVRSGLKPLAYRYSPFGGYDIKLDKWKKQTKCDDYTKIPNDILAPYATMDALVTWRIQCELWTLVDEIDRNFPNEKYPEWTIRRWYETQMMEIYKEICNVEYRGIYVNWELMEKYRCEMVEDLRKKDEELRKIWGVDKNFNISSTTEVGKLFEKLGWTCCGRNEAGVYLTGDEAMGTWSREGRPGVDLLAEYRTEKTSLGSFVGLDPAMWETHKDWPEWLKPKETTGWLQYIYHDEKDGNPEEGGSYRVQQSYLVMGTETYRFIGKDPNFQNIPTRNKYAGYVKKCIDTPPADLYTVVGSDGKEYNLAEFELVYTNEGYKTAKECFANMRRLQFIDNDPEHPAVLRCGFDKQEDGSFKKPDPKVWFEV